MKAETKHFFKKVSIAGLIFGLAVLGMVFFINGAKAQDKPIIKVPNDEWDSQVVFDTVQVCYQGTLNWVAMGNPNLLNTPPPYHIARVMTIHCFCVLDKLRTAYKLAEWREMLSKDNPLAPTVAPKQFMQKAVECIKDHNTLAGLVVLDPKMLDEFLNDNETSTRKEESDNSSRTLDSIPEQPNEPIEETPQLNF
jgi:hypothetical protein